MFIAQAFKFKHEFWRYLIGSLVVIVASTIGQFPLMGVLIFKVINDGKGFETINEKTMYTMLDSNLFLFLVMLSFVAAFIGLWLVVKYLHKQTMTSVATARPKLDWKRIWFAFAFWGIISSGLVLIDYFFLSPDDYLYNFELKRFLILLVIAVALIPIQTSLEEYMFRGYLMQGFGTATANNEFPFAFLITLLSIPVYILIDSLLPDGIMWTLLAVFCVLIFVISLYYILKATDFFNSRFYSNLKIALRKNWVPLIITSVIFGGLHMFNPEVEKLGYGLMVYYIGTGLFLGIITLMDEGTELALGFHAANNLFTALLVTADWTAFQTHSILKDVAEPEMGFIDLVLPVFVIFPILIFIFSRMYKWKGWKDKLFGPVHEPPTEDYKIIGEEHI